MKKYIASFDCETTGLNPQEDFIIQLAIVKFDSQTYEEVVAKSWYIKPQHSYEITPGAFDAHGLTKEFIESNGVPLKDIASEIIEILQDCDYLTYNGNRFDVKFLSKDFELAGFQFPLEDKHFYDSFAMECKYNPRDLSTVYKRYTGKDMVDAHNAFADVKATIEVFKSQVKTYSLDEETMDSMEENNMLSPEGSIRRSQMGDDIVFSFGKYKDSEFYSICKKDYNYVDWFLKNVASNYTKNILREYYKKKRSAESK